MLAVSLHLSDKPHVKPDCRVMAYDHVFTCIVEARDTIKYASLRRQSTIWVRHSETITMSRHRSTRRPDQ
jgi:hypothetical protein